MTDIKPIIEDIVGPENVSDEDFTCITYSRDITPAPPRKPSIVVLPTNTEEVSKILRIANRTRTPVTTRAGATAGGICLASEGGIVLDLSKMDKILKINEEEMYITVQGGCPVYLAIKELGKRGWRIPLRPMFGPRPTIGSWINTIGCGQGMTRFGYWSENVTGVEAVLPTGEIVRTGVAGFSNCEPFSRYAQGSDLTGLFVGARGAFGVITEISSRIYPKPEAIDFITFSFKDWEPLIKATHKILRAEIAWSIDLVGSGVATLAGVPEIPFPDMPLLVLMIEGSSKEVENRIEVARKIGLEEGGTDVGADIGRFLFEKAFVLGFGHKMPIFGHFGCIDAYAHSISATPELYRIFMDTTAKYKVGGSWYSWIFRGMIISFPGTQYKEPEQWEDMLRAWNEIADKWFRLKNVTPGIIVPNPDFTQLFRPTYYWLLRTIKQALDPNNILNPHIIPHSGGGSYAV